MLFDVFTTVRIRVNRPDQNKAEELAITLLNNHLTDMWDNTNVVESGIILSPQNPVSVEVTESKPVLTFTLVDTGERRVPRGTEQYFLVDDPKLIFNWEEYNGDETLTPEAYGILKLEAK